MIKKLNISLLCFLTLLNASGVYYNSIEKEKQSTHESHDSLRMTGEFPIDSFVMVRTNILMVPSKCLKDDSKCTKEESHPLLAGNASSGVIVYSDETGSLILTAEHSCNPKTSTPELEFIHVAYSLTTGVGVESIATIYAMNTEHDLCLLLSPVPIGLPMRYTSEQPILHKKIRAMATPLALGGPRAVPVFEGRFFGNVNAGTSSYGIPSAPGSSGGPIFTEDLKIVGIITAVAVGYKQFTLATTTKQTADFLDKYIPLEGTTINPE